MAADLLTRSGTARLPWLLAAGSLAVACYLGWQVYGPVQHGDPIATSLLALEKANRLTVFSAQLATVVETKDERGYGFLQSSQIAVIPARVDYTLDLAKLDSARFHWDEAGRKLEVVLPPLQLSKPNLDEAHGHYFQSGVWVTNAAQQKLTRDSTIVAEAEALKQAKNPALLGLAKGAAKQAVVQNLTVPLGVAGLGDVRVTVRFDGEVAPPR